jgi:putative intracellular protease/amidase
MANVEPAERLNDPRKVDYPPARPAVLRGLGTTLSERHLAKLADRSFLNLWSYPNTFIDKKTGGKGDGKALCDLLVVWPIMEDMANAGATVLDQPMVVDENVITSRFIYDIPQFVDAIVAQLH